jgi:hypothetical protein
MKYSKGHTCWNSEARSLTVIFRCEIQDKIVDVQEPTPYEYTMIFETPSVCDEIIVKGSLPRSIRPGRKRPFFIVFDSFHRRSITAVFCRTVYG